MDKPNNKQTLHSERLTLRPFEESDLAWFSQLRANPAVMKNVYTGKTSSAKESQATFRIFTNHWQEHQFGCWVMIENTTKLKLGYCGFHYFEEKLPELKDAVEVGYVLDEMAWGKGYATEALKLVVTEGTNLYRFTKILATTSHRNTASQKVLLKAGFEKYPDIDIYGSMHCLYGISQKTGKRQ